MRLLSLAAALMLALPVVAEAAPATFSSCVGEDPAYDLTTRVTNTTACTISNDFDQDFLNPPTVNVAPGFFRITTWNFLGKDSSGGQSGTYDFSAALNALILPGGTIIDQVMLVFKSSRTNENSGSDLTLVAYLAEVFVVSGDYVVEGDWDTPFSEPPFTFPGNNDKDVSHISAYYTTKVAAIPLPAAGWALLAALGGLGLVARRRRAA